MFPVICSQKWRVHLLITAVLYLCLQYYCKKLWSYFEKDFAFNLYIKQILTAFFIGAILSKLEASCLRTDLVHVFYISIYSFFSILLL